jgi:hypothetical protein
MTTNTPKFFEDFLRGGSSSKYYEKKEEYKKDKYKKDKYKEDEEEEEEEKKDYKKVCVYVGYVYMWGRPAGGLLLPKP